MDNITQVGTLDLITLYADAAKQELILPTPARTSEADQRRAYRRVAQVRLNVVGLPRGLRVAA